MNGRTIQQGWEALYAKLIASGWSVTRFQGNAVSNGEQSVTLTLSQRKEQNDQGS